MFSKRLSRQLKKKFGWKDFDKEYGQFLELIKSLGDSAGDVLKFTENLSEFLKDVDESYEDDHKRVEIATRSLEVSTRELGVSNEKLQSLNGTLQTMLDNLEEGYLVLDLDGYCGDIQTKVAAEIVGKEPHGMHFSEILGIKDDQIEVQKDWYKMLVSEVLDFDELARLAPGFLMNSESEEEKIISVRFKPVRDCDGKLVNVALILQDMTAAENARKRAVEMQEFASMMLSLSNNRSSFMVTLKQCEDMAKQMVDWQESECSLEDIAVLVRRLHTLKGSTGAFHIYEVQNSIHDIESRLSEGLCEDLGDHELQDLIVTQGKAFKRDFDRFVNKNSKIFEKGTETIREVPYSKLQKVGHEMIKNSVKAEIVDMYVKDVMSVSFASMFGVVESSVASRSLVAGKEVQFLMCADKDVTVVPEAYSEFFESVLHIFNNCIDHGIEYPDQRSIAGKESFGTIRLGFHQEENNINIMIEDDGAGIDVERIRSKMGEEGANMTDAELLHCIFNDGLSTSDEVDHRKGRGVGMSAVKQVIEEMGGSITVESVLGKGTTFQIKLPLTNGEFCPTLRAVS